jgi:large subunit ribosomal protein L35
MRSNAGKQHIMTSKTTKQKRGMRGTTTVDASDTAKLQQMLPYK